MPLYRLSSDDEPKLVAQPETGMGFQVIFAGIFPGRDGRFLVLSSALMLPARDREELRTSLLELAEVTNGEDADLDGVPAEQVFLRGEIRTLENRLTGIAEPPFGRRPLFRKTALVVERRSAQPHLFFRFSPRRRDPRVDSKNGNFAPGTYAVPWSEVPLVPSGFAAVGRFALPNPFAARRVYPIVTNSTPQLIGAAAPNYGQAGGGVEVLFPNGAIALHGVPHLIPDF